MLCESLLSEPKLWSVLQRTNLIYCVKFISMDGRHLVWGHLSCHLLQILKLKLVSAIFYQIFIFHQMAALQKLWKILFISSEKLFCSQDIQVFVFPSSLLFLTVSHYFKGCSNINLKVCDAINCLNNSFIIHFVWYL